MRKHKYGAEKSICNLGHAHPSKLESSVCSILQTRQKAGDIRNLKYQHTIHLPMGFRWKIDFSFEQLEIIAETPMLRGVVWKEKFAEAKGAEDVTYRRNIRMWKQSAKYGEIELWKGSWKNPKLVQIVKPSHAHQDDRSGDSEGVPTHCPGCRCFGDYSQDSKNGC